MTTNVKNNLNKNKMGNILMLNVWEKLGWNVMLSKIYNNDHQCKKHFK